MNGYEYTRQLKDKIAESPTHTLDLSDAISFIRRYRRRNPCVRLEVIEPTFYVVGRCEK